MALLDPTQGVVLHTFGRKVQKPPETMPTAPHFSPAPPCQTAEVHPFFSTSMTEIITQPYRRFPCMLFGSRRSSRECGRGCLTFTAATTSFTMHTREFSISGRPGTIDTQVLPPSPVTTLRRTSKSGTLPAASMLSSTESGVCFSTNPRHANRDSFSQYKEGEGATYKSGR